MASCRPYCSSQLCDEGLHDDDAWGVCWDLMAGKRELSTVSCF